MLTIENDSPASQEPEGNQCLSTIYLDELLIEIKNAIKKRTGLSEVDAVTLLNPIIKQYIPKVRREHTT